MVKIGHASISENGGINGNPGDQTGGEVTTRLWYNKSWSYVIRPKAAVHAIKIARFVKYSCANDNIGYGQYDRLGLYNELVRIVGNKYKPADVKKIGKKVNCDCSSLVAAAIISAGIYISPSMTTFDEYNTCIVTGCFTAYTGSICTSSDNLKVGDILLATTHTAVVISSDNTNMSEKLEPTLEETCADYPAFEYDAHISGHYRVSNKVTTYLSMRAGAGTEYRDMAHLKSGHQLICYGYHTAEWYYVVTYVNHVMYTGFVNNKYIVKE